MEIIHGIPYKTFTRPEYIKMQGPPMDDGEGGPGGPGGPGPDMPPMPENKPEFCAVEVKNGKLITKGGELVAEEDIVSVRGKGRFFLSKINHNTKKGRISVTLKKYIS